MEFKYEGNSLKSGVYKITNTINGRIYIGSAKEFKERWRSHAHGLTKGNHHNKFLQNDFNKCGTNVFVFEVVELVVGTIDDRLLIEQKYLDLHFDGGKKCYNLTKEAVGNIIDKKQRKTKSDKMKQKWQDPIFKQKMLDVFHSEEYKKSFKEGFNEPENKEYMKAAAKKRCQEHPELLDNLHKAQQKHFHENPEELKKIQSMAGKASAQKRMKTYTFRNPQGEVVKIRGLVKYCGENNLSVDSMFNILNGSLLQHRGWTNSNRTLEEIREQSTNNKDVSKTRKQSFTYTKGKRSKNTTDGWNNEEVRKKRVEGINNYWKDNIERKRKVSEEMKTRRSKEIKTYRLVSPAGENTTITNMSQFCRDNPEYDMSGLCAVTNGRWLKYKGWTKPVV